jgi:DNA-binding NarL/FixJ family response regulator
MEQQRVSRSDRSLSRRASRRAKTDARLRLQPVPDEPQAQGVVTAGDPRTPLTRRVAVHVAAADPVSRAGVDGQLRYRPEVRLLNDAQQDQAEVTIVVTDEVDETAVRMIRSAARNGCARIVLVATRLDDGGLLAGIEAGVSGLIRRGEATGERLVNVVRAALAGDGTMPPDLLGRLLSQVGSLQRQLLAPRGLTFSGLTQREVAVLRLVADGLSTKEIAVQLAYSERTIKNVIHDLTTRLQLRNRSHAVAYALRRGLI